MRTLPFPTACRTTSHGLLIGRVWRHDGLFSLSVVAVRDGEVIDITRTVPTTADLFDRPDAVASPARRPANRSAASSRCCRWRSTARAARPTCSRRATQAIKACGVTFAVSLIERVIEEQAGGDPVKAADVRATIAATIGTDLSKIVLA